MIIPVSELIASAKSQCNCMNPHAAKKFYENNEGTVIIDVREPHEAEKGKLTDSINIPRGLLEMKVTEHCEQHDIPILIHCAAAGRASLSAYTLQIMGYSNVHVIDANFDDILEVFK